MKEALVGISQILLIGSGLNILVASQEFFLHTLGLVMFIIGLDWRYVNKWQ